jgi:hypothetical protein
MITMMSMVQKMEKEEITGMDAKMRIAGVSEAEEAKAQLYRQEMTHLGITTNDRANAPLVLGERLPLCYRKYHSLWLVD